MEKKYSSIYRVSIVAEPRNNKLYDDYIQMVKYVKEAIKKGNMTLKSITIDVLHGEYNGYSVVAIISESHCSAYTFKEHNKIYIDIATCSDENSLRNMIEYFKKVLIIKNENEINIINMGGK